MLDLFLWGLEVEGATGNHPKYHTKKKSEKCMQTHVMTHWKHCREENSIWVKDDGNILFCQRIKAADNVYTKAKNLEKWETKAAQGMGVEYL